EAAGVAADPRFVDPVATWATDEASPSGLAVDRSGSVWMACLRGQRLYRIATDGSDARGALRGGHGRPRDGGRARAGALWVLPPNRDGRGDPAEGDDRVLR